MLVCLEKSHHCPYIIDPGVSGEVVIQLFQLRLSPGKAEKSNTSAKSLREVTIKNTQTEQNLVSIGIRIVAIYVHKKARSNFELSGKPMNGNVFGNKTAIRGQCR